MSPPRYPFFPRDAASLACVCSVTAAAYRESRWPRAVRTKRSGAVLEPVSGAFDVTVAPGEGVQAAVDRCPPGGCVLLLPGTHDGPLVLAVDQEVHVFGRGRATLRAAAETVFESKAALSTADGLLIRREAGAGDEDIVDDAACAWIKGGALRLQSCDISCASVDVTGLFINGGPGTDPVVTGCKCVGGATSRDAWSWPYGRSCMWVFAVGAPTSDRASSKAES